MARIIVPHYPHHIVQRGNRLQNVFFCPQDKEMYLNLLIQQSKQASFHILAYCLMDNHVHLVVVPETRNGLIRGIAEIHRKYTCIINERKEWRGYLWQGRFKSYIMDEHHLLRAIRYIERNPIVAGIVDRAEHYKWSSAYAHIFNVKDRVLSETISYVNFDGWNVYINTADNNNDPEIFRRHENTGRPLADNFLIEKLELELGRTIQKRKPGRKPKSKIGGHIT